MFLLDFGFVSSIKLGNPSAFGNHFAFLKPIRFANPFAFGNHFAFQMHSECVSSSLTALNSDFVTHFEFATHCPL